jgi:small-conductance mechanosensitive channel
MGLGGHGTTLAEARKKADEARKIVAEGNNPIEAKREARTASAAKPTFGQCADALLQAKSSEWRNEKHCAQWQMTLADYAKPLRALPVDEVDTAAVLGVLQPLWQAKAETAFRLRGRIETVLDAARAMGHIPRNEANPARWRGHLDKLLPKRQKLTRGHHAALAYESKKNALDQAGNRLRESIAELRQFAGAIPDRGQGARILKVSFNLMFAVADTVSRVERKWVSRFFNQRSGHKSGNVRARKAQDGWQVLALTIAKEKNQRLSVARVAHNVICDERWSTNGSRPKERRPKERTVYDFLRRNKNAWRNEEKLQVN